MNIKKNLLLYTLSLASIANMTSCCRKVNCSERDSHVHCYISDNGFIRYSNLEYGLLPGGYKRQKDIMYTSPYEVKYYNFLNDNDLLDLSLNYDYLVKYFPKLDDCVEYEYIYKKLVDLDNVFDEDGNIISSKPIYKNVIDWCRIVDDKELTGNQRIVSYGYMGYKIVYNDRYNNFEYIKSGYYSSIDDLLRDGYTHIKLKSFASHVDKNLIIKNDMLVLSK